MNTKYEIHENQTRQTTFFSTPTDEYKNINSYASSI